MFTGWIWNHQCDCYLIGLACLSASALVCLIARTASNWTWSAWIGTFCVAQGLAAWIELAATWQSPATTVPYQAVEIILLIMSLAALFELGRWLSALSGGPELPVWLPLFLLALAALGLFTGSATALKIACWLAIGLPAVLLVTISSFRLGLKGSRQQRASQIMGTGGLCLFAVFEVSDFQSGAAVGALCMFLGAWLAMRSCPTVDLRLKRFSGWMTPAAVGLLAIVGCYLLGSGESEAPFIVGDAFEVVEHSSPWHQESAQRWRVALPVFAVLFGLPALGGIAYWCRLALVGRAARKAAKY